MEILQTFSFFLFYMLKYFCYCIKIRILTVTNKIYHFIAFNESIDFKGIIEMNSHIFASNVTRILK